MACVRSFGGVGIYNPCAAFVVLMGKPTGGREIPPPRAITIKTERKIMWKENHSEKDAHYALALALALALSLTACGQPNAEQPTDPAPSTSVPEPIAPPEPIKDPAPESEPEQTPAAPVETEDTQPPEETESQEDEVQLFTDVNETVYATGTVNIRASYTTDSEKLGSLSVGQSVTRTGTAIAGTEAEGWSRIQLSDGSTVYVSNKYLSTTKPVVQQQTSKPSSGQQSKPSESTQQQQPQQTQTETQPSDDGWVDPMQQLKDLESQGYTRAGSNNTYSDADREILGKLLNGG